MGSSSLSSCFQIPSSTNFPISPKPSISHHKFLIRMPTTRPIDCSWSSSSSPSHGIFRKSLPLAASISILLCSTPEENQKKYAEFDERFKSSPLLKKLLEQSKLNKEKNQRELQDKYCIRGAEWGVGDCSAEGMSPDERDKFIAMLKQKAEEK